MVFLWKRNDTGEVVAVDAHERWCKAIEELGLRIDLVQLIADMKGKPNGYRTVRARRVSVEAWHYLASSQTVTVIADLYAIAKSEPVVDETAVEELLAAGVAAKRLANDHREDLIEAAMFYRDTPTA